MTAARAEYLPALAHLCHCPPPVTDGLAVTDFGRLTMWIDALGEERG